MPPTEGRPAKHAWLNDVAAKNRSAGTIYLEWIRQELEGHLRVCHLDGLQQFFACANTDVATHTMRASKAVHRYHGAPIDPGYESPWPCQLQQYSARDAATS